jgi:hypothetical protein
MNPNFQSFVKQAQACREMGSPFTADILEALAIVLDMNTLTGKRISSWPAEPLVDALPLRLAGGLHALARRKVDPALTAVYENFAGDIAGVLRATLISHDSELVQWLDSPPQTNEVGRASALYAGLLVITHRYKQPIELFELGASAGLNLNLDRFAYVLGGENFGDVTSAVKLVPKWQGKAPPASPPIIVARSGVDLNPVDVRNEQVADRLIAYVWPDQSERLARIAAAISISIANPPKVGEGDAAEWLKLALARPQPDGTTRVIMHSVFWQYLPQITQQKITELIEKASEYATEARPLCHLTFEAVQSLYTMELRLKSWPDASDQLLATCHPHATSVDWLV